MKNMTKTRWILCAVLAAVAVLALSAVLWVYRFNTVAIESPLDLAGTIQFEEGGYRRSEVVFDCVEREKYLPSKAYAFQDETQTQIRFRLLYSVPFSGKDIFSQTDFTLTNENGEDLSQCISAYTDRFTGFNGVNVQLNFSGEAHPRSGETLTLIVTASEAGEEPYASCKILLTVP